jgi:hypothetical protein
MADEEKSKIVYRDSIYVARLDEWGSAEITEGRMDGYAGVYLSFKGSRENDSAHISVRVLISPEDAAKLRYFLNAVELPSVEFPGNGDLSDDPVD